MVTIRDVAKECGLSPASVSRILNNDSSLQVTDATRKKVVAAAKKLGYVKKSGAKSKASFTLGILQWFSARQELEDAYYLRVRKGVEDFCVKNSIQIIRAYRTDKDYMDTLKDCDGLVCVGKFGKKDADRLIEFKPNIVFLDMLSEHPEVTTLTIDFYTAAKEALNYLKALGHKSIAYLGGVEYASGAEIIEDERRKAYIKFMKRNKFSYADILKEDEFNSVSGYKMMKEILNGKRIPTAVFAASDPIAVGAMKAIKEAGMKIPEDISVISINDDEMSAFTEPPLTTMHAPSYDMGQHGANLVYVAGNLDIKTRLKVLIPCTMVKRSSCTGI
jgi:LacI family transcriptional regulator